MTSSRRYLAAELSPTYAFSRTVSVGAYYLYSYGLEADASRHVQYLAVRANLSHIRLSDQYSLQFGPQVYFLRTGSNNGYCANAAATLNKAKLPLSVSATVNRSIQTRIPGGTDVLWNVSLNYAIH